MKNKRDKQLSKLKPIAGETKYVEFDEDSGLWCVFGSESGFAYSSHASEAAASCGEGMFTTLPED